MTDAEYGEQKARVKALIDKWPEHLGLGWWKLTYVYERELDGETERDNKVANWVTTFRCRAQWQYSNALITAFLPTIASLSDEDLEQAFVHELCHVLVSEMREPKKDHYDHEERVATTLAKAFIWVREAAKEEAKTDA